MNESNKSLEFDEDKTSQRFKTLKDYYQNNILCGDEFICKSASECRGSVANGLKFYEAQLSHVGGRYDIVKNGKELRIVVSGIEFGPAPAKVDADARLKMVLNETGIKKRYYSEKNHGYRNPHMRGTTLLLRRILLGSESLKDYADWESEFVGVTGQVEDNHNNHIFNMFALVNFRLCSVRGNNARARSSQLTLLKCSAHYLTTLEILEPTLVVFQGKNKFKDVLKAAHISDCWQQKSEHLGYFKRNGLKFVTCEFSHPASPTMFWGDKPTRPYFKEHVLPTLGQALKVMGLE